MFLFIVTHKASGLI